MMIIHWTWGYPIFRPTVTLICCLIPILPAFWKTIWAAKGTYIIM